MARVVQRQADDGRLPNGFCSASPDAQPHLPRAAAAPQKHTNTLPHGSASLARSGTKDPAHAQSVPSRMSVPTCLYPLWLAVELCPRQLQYGGGSAELRSAASPLKPGPGADVAGASRVPVQMWPGEPSPVADVAVSRVPVQMWAAASPSWCRCGGREPFIRCIVCGTHRRER